MKHRVLFTPSRRWPRRGTALFLLVFVVAVAAAAVLAAAVTWGGPGEIKPLASINDLFRTVDFRSVPPASHFTARDGSDLAWHRYVPNLSKAGKAQRRVVLVHGSSARGQSMHVLAQALAAQGFAVAALDIRGHGDSGVRGQIGYVGQLEDDMEDFMQAVPHAGPQTLMGFSSGGGFVLRFAADKRQGLFDRYVLLSPFLHQSAPTNLPSNGDWVSVGLPRMVALSMFNSVGVTRWNHLPVLRFGLNAAARRILTPSYSYALATNFRPHDDYLNDIANAPGTVCMVAGQDDELFHADRFAEVFRRAGNPVPVTLVPGVNHMGLTLDAAAVRAVAQACIA